MSNQDEKANLSGLSLPMKAMVVIGILGGIVVGASMEAIKYWPLPASVTPYFGFGPGFVWGAIVGGVSGLVLGFLTDDRHFQDV